MFKALKSAGRVPLSAEHAKTIDDMLVQNCVKRIESLSSMPQKRAIQNEHEADAMQACEVARHAARAAANLSEKKLAKIQERRMKKGKQFASDLVTVNKQHPECE